MKDKHYHYFICALCNGNIVKNYFRKQKNKMSIKILKQFITTTKSDNNFLDFVILNFKKLECDCDVNE